VSDPLPAHASIDAAGEAYGPIRRHRRLTRARAVRGVAPYALIAPSLAVIVAILGYPVYFLARLSFERYGLPEIIAGDGVWVGLENFSSILGDRQFWDVVLRTVVFTAVNVALTMVLGTLIALLMKELRPLMRSAVAAALVLAWAMPVVVAAQLWIWMTNYENGVLNYILTELHLGDFRQYDWFANPYVGFGVITSLIVWGAVPFVAITIYAGLTQVPGELLEAAQIDGSGAFRRFRDVIFPILKPIFVILISLSIIWDFQVFTQPFLLRMSRPDPDYWLMSIYAYEKSFGISQYGLGSAIALVMLLIMVFVTFFYIRQMVRVGEVK
jgi:N,N'-diacetylchitobiose transport system permease protein